MPVLVAGKLVLEPLTAAHADAMFAALSDPELYRFLDEEPPASADALRVRYAKLETRRSPDGSQEWLNWIICTAGQPIGFVQGTVVSNDTSWIAYLVATRHQRRGIARAALTAMLRHLELKSITRFRATVERDNAASIATLHALGFVPCDASAATSTPTERAYIRHVGAPREKERPC